MAYKTITTWLVDLDILQREDIQIKLDEMVAQGKTDGIPDRRNYENVPPDPPPPLPLQVVRTWTTEADAQEFKDFLINYFGSGIQSVNIEILTV